MQWNTAKIYSFTAFYVVWGYCRHYLNILILWSIWYEMPTKMPYVHISILDQFDSVIIWLSWFSRHSAKEWNWTKGTYGPDWILWHIFLPLSALQVLNIYWYYLMTKILIRYVAFVFKLASTDWYTICRGFLTRQVEDTRSDDEYEGHDQDGVISKKHH